MQTVAHYTILERLGSGALGDVYRARDLEVGRTVALMTPPIDLLADPSVKARFLADARAAAALNHPNITTLFDVVEQDGRCYLAYEFAAGPSLREEMGGGAINVRRALELAAQIADALAEGHTRGIVHGDLRPETIVVTPKGSAKILSFGLGGWTDAGRARSAAAGPGSFASDPHGVAGYLSPEQAEGRAADARSDLFSFGTILYEMVGGSNPFAAPAPAAVAGNVVGLVPPPLSTVVHGLPAGFDVLVARLMSKKPEDRPRNAQPLPADLRRIAGVLDARAGDAVKSELIPPDDKQGFPIWWLLGPAIIGLVLLAWWLMV